MTMLRTGLLGTAMCSAFAILAGPALAQDRVTIDWWIGVGGRVGELTQEFVTRFNESQDQYTVVATHKGNYEETMAAMVAAYRAGQHPTMIMAAERGFMTMLNSGAIVPVNQLMADQGYDTEWGEFIAPVAGFYVVDGAPVALPFNSSSPILWFNEDLFAAAGFDGIADNWPELESQLYALKEQGVTDCPMALPGDFVWSMLENYSAVNNYSWGTRENGFEGLDTEFVYNTTQVVPQVERLAKWVADGVLHPAGQGMDPGQMFNSGTCASIFMSTAAHAGVESAAEFNWNATYLPREEGVTELHNSTIGGGSIWVLQNRSEEEYAAAAAFLDFVSSTAEQAWWSAATGYVPVTTAAYEQMAAEGYFVDHPTREIAILQLSRGTPNENSRGFRFGNYNQATAILVEEIQSIWTGQKSVQQALDSAVSRGNEILRQYERLHGG